MTILVYQKGSDNSISIRDFDPDFGEILVYPNPFRDQITIELPVFENNINSLQLFNSRGKLVFEQREIEGNRYSLKNNNLEKGMYFIRIISGKVYTTKIFVN